MLLTSTPNGVAINSTTGFWHLTLCTLLSSQGSDAPGFHACACRSRATCLCFVTLSLSRRATCLTYHQACVSQIDPPETCRSPNAPAGWVFTLILEAESHKEFRTYLGVVVPLEAGMLGVEPLRTFRTFGVTGDYITWIWGVLQITVHPGRVAPDFRGFPRPGVRGRRGQ